MNNVVSLAAYRAAIFRGTRDRPAYHPDDIQLANSSVSLAEVERWLATINDGGDAA